MTTTEIKKEIERIDKAIFIEHMADFLDWNAVRSLEKEKAKLKEMLNDKPDLTAGVNKELENKMQEANKRHINALVAGILAD